MQQAKPPTDQWCLRLCHQYANIDSELKCLKSVVIAQNILDLSHTFDSQDCNLT